jgi:N6-adenosine-specific RNA methylase IME4
MTTGKLSFHPIAGIFSLIPENELASLAEDIRANGLREPLWLYENKILDGRNRYLACQLINADLQFRHFEGSYLEAIALVWSMNLKRRHLDSSQAAMAEVDRAAMVKAYAAEVEKLKEEARERQRATGANAPRNEKGQLQPVSQLIDSPVEDRNLHRTDATRARLTGTNRQYLHDAEKIRNDYPEQAEAIKKGEKTISQVAREIKKAEVRQRLATLPSNKYRVIYADPPWNYSNSGSGIDKYGPAERHYPSMTIAELCSMDIESILEENAVLFLWVTSPLLGECWPVIRAWGFEYKTSFVWDKVSHNYGHYNSVRHEFLLICTRGSCTPDIPKLHDSVQVIERSQEHSEKPEAFRAIIDELYPYGKKIELFARKRVEGWDFYGNEV